MLEDGQLLVAQDRNVWHSSNVDLYVIVVNVEYRVTLREAFWDALILNFPVLDSV